MMQSVPAHTYASRDALRYLVINYIYSCPDACYVWAGTNIKLYGLYGKLAKGQTIPHQCLSSYHYTMLSSSRVGACLTLYFQKSTLVRYC